MTNRPITFDYECPGCEALIEIKAWPVIPAKLFGLPENCYPEEGGEFEPGECQKCGFEFDPEKVQDAASWESECRADDAADATRDDL